MFVVFIFYIYNISICFLIKFFFCSFYFLLSIASVFCPTFVKNLSWPDNLTYFTKYCILLITKVVPPLIGGATFFFALKSFCLYFLILYVLTNNSKHLLMKSSFSYFVLPSISYLLSFSLLYFSNSSSTSLTHFIRSSSVISTFLPVSTAPEF